MRAGGTCRWDCSRGWVGWQLRSGARRRRVDALRLRQHDLLFAVVSYAIGPVARQRRSVRHSATGNFILSVAIVVSVGHERPRLADPRRAQRPRRPADAVPAVLHGPLRSCRPRSSARARRAIGLALFIVANFAYQAALIYYDATLKTVSRPETRGRLSGIGVGVGYCRDDLCRAVPPRLRRAGRDRFLVAAVLFGLFAIPIFLFVREPTRPVVRDLDAATSSARWTPARGRRSRTRGRCPACCGSSSGGSSTRTRSTRSSS